METYKYLMTSGSKNDIIEKSVKENTEQNSIIKRLIKIRISGRISEVDQMAASNGRKSSTSNKKSTRSTKGTKASASRRKEEVARLARESALFHEIGLIMLFAVMVFLFCCNFGMIGPVGNAVSGVLFGLFGLTAYAAPVLLFLAVAFWFANEGNPNAVRKLIAGVVLFVMLGIVCDLAVKHAGAMEKYSIVQLYEECRDRKLGGGILAGSISYFLQHYLETIGTVLVVLLCSVVSLILLTEKSLLSSVKKGGSRVRELSREDAARRREQAEIRRQSQEEKAQRRREQDQLRRQTQEEQRARKAQERRLKAEEKENEKILRMEKKVSGVMMDTALARPEATAQRRDDIHEIILSEEEAGTEAETQTPYREEYDGADMPENVSGQEPEESSGGNFPEEEEEPVFEFEKIHIRGMHQVMLNEDPEEEPDMPQGEEMHLHMPQRAQNPADMRNAADELPGQSIRIHKEEAGAASDPAERIDREPEETAQGSGAGARSQEGTAQRSEAGAWSQEGTAQRSEAGAWSQEETAQRSETGARNPDGTAQGSENGTRNSEFGERELVPDAGKIVPKKYCFPPITLLQKGVAATGDSVRELKETAMRLQQTLNTFGVKVTITDISQGPSVTRYELQPEQGVKVSKIVGLSDDIKLNLAAMDIRIEAPIPGKAAIGIEVPNKENTPVALRDLLETREFQDFQSNIAFAVGKDIAGKAVVSDIAKMPHMLIAGATGSGKSVCINTLIMSILYKAHPDDVKLIMVVELSIYNGIPHLLIPVVTDPKKASAALHWGVAEMEDRYQKFAEFNVRDLKGYNKKVEGLREKDGDAAPKKLPQIVIIVDELADLMMVCPGEVEESICRLAQLARACGIHLIIATQRPSVDVITGLIKANMPSRVAFSVSSGVDSRTILDMVGAEKLLGKGDMLFYPQGYSKPARVQGAFVSDQEVSDVVDFLKNQVLGNTYAAEIEEKISSLGSSGGGGKSSGGSDVDELFEKAARLIIDKDKASIGMLQRALQIGFNRAARIMDQLCQYGVVGEEEGTKPRKILMSPEQFEQLLDEVL